MLNNSEIVNQLNLWLKNFVEVPHPALGNFAPCPYARAARVNNQIDIKFATVPEFMTVVRESIDTLATKEVVVVAFDHHTIDPVTLQEWVGETNRMLMPMDYVILEDHPDAPEYVNGVKMNFGYCGLLVIQRLNKLNTAADQLRDKGYYDHWNQQALDDVVTWRYDQVLSNKPI
jgi:hypothetical protein